MLPTAMLRYWLAFILVIVPCLGLAVWAGRTIDRNAEREIASSLDAWRDLAREVAQTRIASEVQRITRLGQAAVADPRSGWSRFSTLAADPAVVAVVPLEPGWPPALAGQMPSTLADHPLLREARRCEFVLADHVAAERAYLAATDARLPAPVRDEAWAGLVSGRLAAGDRTAAASTLADWLRRDPPRSAEAAVAIGLELDRAGAAVADQLLTLWELVHAGGRLCPQDLAFALDQALAVRSTAFDPGQRGRWEQRTQPLVAEQRSIAWWTGLDALARAEAQSAEHPLRVGDTVAVTVTDPRLRRSAVIALDPAHLASDASAMLGANPTLGGLARTLGGRLYRAPGLAVAAPWEGQLTVPLPPPDGRSPWLGPQAMTWLVLSGAVACVLAGFLALLLAARRDLRLARLKSDFVSNVSHELKTPIALVRLYGEMLSLGYVKDEAERTKAQAVIVAEAERLGLLVENVLDFARIERGERTYRREPVDLARLIRRVAEAYQPQLATGGFVLGLDLADGLPPVPGDPDALTQVLLNLLANACKFSPEDKRLEVGLARDGGSLRWTARDHGIGIPAAEHLRIFQPFYRVESGLTRTTRGAGIGLALVHHIVSGHRGTVAVDSAPGRGTTMIIHLPIAEEEEPCPTRPS